MNLSDAYVIFELEGAAYAVRSSEVQHIGMLEHITRVPSAAPAVDGVVFSRGQVFPAINLRIRFGLSRKDYSNSTRLIFLKVQDRAVALIVDAAREFQVIARDAIRPIEETLVGIHGSHVEGVATVKGRTVLVLNLGVVLTLDEIAPIDSARVAEMSSGISNLNVASNTRAKDNR